MNRGFKTILMMAAALCVIGAILTLAGRLMGGQEYVRAADLNTLDGAAMKSDAAAAVKKTKIDDIKGVNIEFDYMDLEIVPSEDDAYCLEYAVDPKADDTSKEGAAVSWTVTDGVLSMREEAPEAGGMVVSLPDIGALFGGEKTPQAENQVILYIPEGSVLADSAIRIDDGDLTVDGVAFSAPEISLGYGNAKLADAGLRDGQIRVEDGDLIMKDTELSGMKLTMEYGELSVSGGSLEDTDIEMADGNITCGGTVVRGDCSISAEYGDVETALAQGCLETLELRFAVKYGEIIMDQAARNALGGGLPESGDAAQFVRNPENPEGSLKIVVEDGNIVVK